MYTIVAFIFFILALCYYAFASVVAKGIGIGAWFPLLVSGSMLILAVFRVQLKKLLRQAYKPLLAVYWAGLGAFAVTFALYLSFSLRYSAEELPPNIDAVIILGCRAVGENPGPSLQSRCEVALEVLERYPEALCIASGGVDSGNTLSEAFIMKRYLVNKGIAPERIYCEEASTSTESNLRLSLALADSEGITLETVVLATNDFHAPRAVMLAENKGLTAYTATSPGPSTLIVPNYIREYFALVKSMVFDMNKE